MSENNEITPGQQFLGLDVDKLSRSAYLPVVDKVCTSAKFLYGGSAMASAIESLETISGRPLIWASTQYSNFANPPSDLNIEVVLSAEGNNVTQGRLVGKVGEKEIFSTVGSMGKRDVEASGQWNEFPKHLPGPEECEPFGLFRTKNQSIDARIDFRIIEGWFKDTKNDDGSQKRLRLWTRIPEWPEISASTLAFMADYLPIAIMPALGRMAGGNSLDNTIRIMQIEQSEWVLCETEIHAAHHGFGHGTMRMFSQSGKLLAIASQSFILRFFDQPASK